MTGNNQARPGAILVVGAPASGLDRIGQQLGLLGLRSVRSVPGEKRELLDDLNRALLEDLGATARRPALLPRPEFLAKVTHREAEARVLVDQVMGLLDEPVPGGPWVWADPILTQLAPFWCRVVGRPTPIVLAHRRPAESAAALREEWGVPIEDALVAWDEYNRLALSLLEEHSGVVVGVERYADDVKAGVEFLGGFLSSFGQLPSDDQVGEAVRSFEPLEAPAAPAPTVPNRFAVLDRALARSDNQLTLDADALVSELANYYDEEYYQHYGNPGDAPYLPGEPQWREFFAGVAAHIKDEIKPTTVLDAGCALGFLVDALRAQEIDASGVDVSAWAISQVPAAVRPHCRVGSLTDELEGHYDLITIIEVIEHLPDAAADAVIGNLARHADAVLLSSTSDGFEEATHINVRTPDHWARLFAQHGFFRDFTYDASYLSADAILFRRSSPNRAELVAGYEERTWTTRRFLQGILDQVVPERDHLVEAIGEFAQRAGLAENGLAELTGRLQSAEARRHAESRSFHDELLRRDRLADDLDRDLRRSRAETRAALELVAAVQGTKVFRYSARLRSVYARLRGRPPIASDASVDVPDAELPPLRYAEWSARYDTVDDAARRSIRFRMNAITAPPVISVVLPVYNTPERFLREAIQSVRDQLYPHWELCIVDDASTEPHVTSVLEEAASSDRRIRVLRREENGHISAATNSALELASGEWVAFLDHDDRLREHALALMAITADEHPDAGLLYSDEHVIDAEGTPLHHYFKPSFDRLLLLGMNHVCHLTMARRALVERVGGMRVGFEGSQDWDLLLRLGEHLADDQVQRVPHVLYEWRSHRGSTAQSLEAKPYAADAGARAVSEHLDRTGQRAQVVPVPALGWNHVVWEVPDPPPKVSVIIPTRDGKWLPRCLKSLWSYTTYPNMEILVVDNGSTESATLELLRGYEGRVTVMRDDRPFSYSGLNNAAAGRAAGEVLCLLNDDTEVLNAGWLDEMVGHLLRPGVGAVGAKLYYDNNTVQHAGVVLGIGGVGGHIHRGLDRLEIGYWGRAVCAQQLSAVTGACMLVRKEAWDAVGGLNEDQLAVAYNDVDLCLRLGEAGWRVVWTPFAELVHHESVSRGLDHDGPNAQRLSGEAAFMHDRWGMLLRNDPAYNPNLSLTCEDFSLASPPRQGYLGGGPIC